MMVTMIPLSIIVISYNMQRELPRTNRTLSPAMQNGVSASDYDVNAGVILHQ